VGKRAGGLQVGFGQRVKLILERVDPFGIDSSRNASQAHDLGFHRQRSVSSPEGVTSAGAATPSAPKMDEASADEAEKRRRQA